jgi:hypothetical protein
MPDCFSIVRCQRLPVSSSRSTLACSSFTASEELVQTSRLLQERWPVSQVHEGLKIGSGRRWPPAASPLATPRTPSFDVLGPLAELAIFVKVSSLRNEAWLLSLQMLDAMLPLGGGENCDWKGVRSSPFIGSTGPKEHHFADDSHIPRTTGHQASTLFRSIAVSQPWLCRSMSKCPCKPEFCLVPDYSGKLWRTRPLLIRA